MPDRKFTYQKEIAHMKHEIEKENDAKAKLARDIRDFQRQFQMMEEENMRLRKRVTELEARAAIPELSREQSEKQEGTQGQLNQASNSQQFVP
jgi:septal ring factor EnvC (AmiA/AmiB activator)